MWETISRNRLVVSQNKGYPQSSFICRWIFCYKLINNHPFIDPFFDIHHKPSIIDFLMDKPAINHPFIDGYPSHKPSIYRWFFPSFHGRKSTEKLATAPAECPPAWVNARGARRDRCERPPGFSHRERRKTHGKIMGKIMVIAWWIMVNDDGSWLLMRIYWEIWSFQMGLRYNRDVIITEIQSCWVMLGVWTTHGICHISALLTSTD